MDFFKYHGLGNDFVIIHDFIGERVQQAPLLAPQLCDRHFGVGADGLVLLTRPDKHYAMRIFNADGSEAEMCGNAIRCAAKHLWDFYLADGGPVTIGTLMAPKEIWKAHEGYAVDMGVPLWQTDDISRTTPQVNASGVQLEAAGQQLSVHAVSLGNPHAVIFVSDVDAVDLARVGRAVETHSLFPNQTNVEFVQVLDHSRLKVRVWERGVGATLACGTGACASAVAAANSGLVARSCTVSLPGGDLQIEWKEDGRVWMTGPAVRVYAGRLETTRSGFLW